MGVVNQTHDDNDDDEISSEEEQSTMPQREGEHQDLHAPAASRTITPSVHHSYFISTSQESLSGSMGGFSTTNLPTSRTSSSLRSKTTWSSRITGLARMHGSCNKTINAA